MSRPPPFLCPQMTPEDERLNTIRDILGHIGESRDEAGSLARKRLAIELVGIVLKRQSTIPIDSVATQELDMVARFAGVSILKEQWRQDRVRECQDLIPLDCAIRIDIEQTITRGVVSISTEDESVWARSIRRGG